MAVPKVFVSSTCYDLGEVREQLNGFIKSFGFEPILSENGDVFYHPDLHTHEACVHEVGNCQLFILIIGGRFGGEYKFDKEKSITNAEYDAARKANIPVFAYIKKGVLSDHYLYQKNKNEEFVHSIKYPSVDNQAHAIDIFKFIDRVRQSPVNNAFEGFDKYIDIDQHLRKQWAGMFFDFLKTREVKSQIDVTNNLITGLKKSSSKLEELVKNLYISVSNDKSDAEQSINNIEKMSIMQDFFTLILNQIQMYYKNEEVYMGLVPLKATEESIEQIIKINPNHFEWYEYLEQTDLFFVEFLEGDEIYLHANNAPTHAEFDAFTSEHLKTLFDSSFKVSTLEERKTLYRDFLVKSNLLALSEDALA